MKLSISRSKNAASLYVTKSIYVNGKHTSKIVEKLGTYDDLLVKLNGEDPIAWAKSYIAELNRLEKEEKQDIMVKYSPSKLIPKDEQRSFNGGYLFLQKLYHQLNLPAICQEISSRHGFQYNLDSILSRLVYGRIIFPSSKLSTCELSSRFIEAPDFQLQHIYRSLEVLAQESDYIQSAVYSLEVLAQESDYIQSAVYQNSLSFMPRRTGVIYYDCTNYFFEMEQEDGLCQYGQSKEHRPNPIVQMGLFMDADGIPLAFSINPGNTNEQTTLKPLEKKLLSDFSLSKFIVCTDAGLSSTANRLFNDLGERGFVTTQSIKKLKAHLKEWALDPGGWRLAGDKRTYDLSQLDEKQAHDQVFYKERWINEDGLEQKLIVTYSLKYRDYQRHIREGQVERAAETIKANPAKLRRASANDYQRFISQAHCTAEGEVAQKRVLGLDEEKIQEEARYDGFYAVCTNLEDDPAAVIKVNRSRWEIEECFRIIKSEFKARPVYLSRDDRIKAHFLTCFLSLLLYRLLEKQLEGRFTCAELIQGLRGMNFLAVKGEGYIPSYTRTDLTDALHEAFGFHTDYQIISKQSMKKICKSTKE